MPALSRVLAAFALLAGIFVVDSVEVALGIPNTADIRVADLVAKLWVPALEPLFQGIAVLGGMEITSLVGLGLFVHLRRRGLRSESLAVAILPLAVLVEVIYKKLVHHPAPASFRHHDGPSLTVLVENAIGGLGNSFPSGHMMRTVFVYGLLAFVVHRLAPPGLARRLVIPAAAVMISLMAFDRLYLEVHWESDVVGGLLLGATALAAAVAWLERPVAP